MNNRIDQKTKRLIVRDLTPPIRPVIDRLEAEYMEAVNELQKIKIEIKEELKELKQIKLHLAHLSGKDINEKDIK